MDELRNKLKEKTEELKSVKANSKEQLEAINKLLEEHEENMGKVGKLILLHKVKFTFMLVRQGSTLQKVLGLHHFLSLVSSFIFLNVEHNLGDAHLESK